MCYYFDDVIKIEDFNFDNILLDEKSYKNILMYGILYKTLIGVKPLHMMCVKVDGFSREFDVNKYLGLFDYEKYNALYDRVIYLIRLERYITYVFFL